MLYQVGYVATGKNKYNSGHLVDMEPEWLTIDEVTGLFRNYALDQAAWHLQGDDNGGRFGVVILDVKLENL